MNKYSLYEKKYNKLSEPLSKIGRKLEKLEKEKRGNVYKARKMKPLAYATSYLVAKQSKYLKLMARYYKRHTEALMIEEMIKKAKEDSENESQADSEVLAL